MNYFKERLTLSKDEDEALAIEIGSRLIQSRMGIEPLSLMEQYFLKIIVNKNTADLIGLRISKEIKASIEIINP